MELNVVDPEEKAQNDRLDKMLGLDTNLATIMKMALNPDCVDEEKKSKILYSMNEANKRQAKIYSEQYKLTMDIAGNIIEVNSIDERPTEVKTDTGSKLPESEGSCEEI